MRLLFPLLGQRLRRDWLQLVLWIAGTAALALMATAAVNDAFGSESDREGVLRVAMTAPAILIFRGTPNGTGEGEFSFFLIFAFLALLAGLMSTFLAVRHTRAEEEQGRAELVGATPAGRVLPTVATVIHGVLANVVLGLAVAVAFIGGGLEATGSVVAGAAASAAGIAFLSIGLVAAQLFRTSRGANALSVAIVLGAYVVRGIGDAAGTPSADGLHMTPAWPSWLSPIGWSQRTGAYAENDPLPLLLSIGLATVLIALVFAFQSVRDSGASILPGLAGRPHAGRILSSSFGLAWKLNSGIVLAWAAGALATGLLATSLTPLVRELGSEMPQIAETLEGLAGAGASLDQALTITFFSIVGILASAAALQVVIRARQEEAHGTAELVLATPVPRGRWLGEYGAVGLIAAMVVIVAAVIGAVLGATSADDPADVSATAIEAAVAQLPAVLVYLGLGLLLFVLVPRATIAAAWALLALGAFFGVFGELIGLPDWVRELSPFAHSPVPVGDDIDWSGGAWMLALGIAGIVAAIAAMRRRELASGG